MRFLPWLVVTLLVACGRNGDEQQSAAPTTTGSARSLVEAAPDDDEADAGAQKRGVAERAGERVTIAACTMLAGSTPGDRGRDPTLEPALLAVALDEFDIDKLPYPNDPSGRRVTGVTREQAIAKCGAAGGRLCTELEWERACKGPTGQLYAGGQRWEPSCAKSPRTCASAHGVLAMGAAGREWTASDVQAIKRLQPHAAAVRGARGDAADVDHRCAHRVGVDPKASADDLGFRCCYGAANKATIPSPKQLEAFAKVDLPPGRLEELLASNKRLASLATDIKYFREQSAIDTIMRRGNARGRDAEAPPPNTKMTTAPMLWRPVPGEEIVLVTGRSKEDSFIVALYRLAKDQYRVAAAMHMKGELGPVVLIYNPYVPRKLHWATCWECYGETGNITYRAENRVTITQK